MRYIALFFPAIISVGIEYKKENTKSWTWFIYLYKYAFFLISNILLTESLITYIFNLGDVTIDAFDSFPFFTKYLAVASLFSVVFPYICRIIKSNISVSFEVKQKTPQ